MSDPDNDIPSTTKVIMRPSAEQIIRHRLAEEEAARLAAQAESEAMRERFMQNFPALLAEKKSAVADQVRMSIYHLNYRGWPDGTLLDVVEGYVPLTRKTWFATRTHVVQRSQTRAACRLLLQSGEQLFLASNSNIYQMTSSVYRGDDGQFVRGYHNIDSNDMASFDAYWPSASQAYTAAKYPYGGVSWEKSIDELIAALREVRREKLT